jgi:hypothetical protein
MSTPLLRILRVAAVALPALAACTSTNPDRISKAGPAGQADADAPAPDAAEPGPGPTPDAAPEPGRDAAVADARVTPPPPAPDAAQPPPPPDPDAAEPPPPPDPDAAEPPPPPDPDDGVPPPRRTRTPPSRPRRTPTPPSRPRRTPTPPSRRRPDPDAAEPPPPDPDAAVPPPPPDGDDDGVPDALDLCPEVPDPDQLDGDADTIGDACDACPEGGPAGNLDADGDGQTPCDGDCDDANGDVYTGADERCDGVDQNCDGEIDEGVLNACGACGPAPAEVCNQIDDDCDGEIDEALGCVIPEICDGLDQDADGQVDEDVARPCIVWLTQSELGGAGRGLGQVMTPVADFDADGVTDLVASSPLRGDAGGALYALSGRDAHTLWRADGDRRLGAALGAGTFFGDGRNMVVATAPEFNDFGTRGRLVFFDAAGAQTNDDTDFNTRYGETLVTGNFCGDAARTCIAVGDPGYDGFRTDNIGRVAVLQWQEFLGFPRLNTVDDWTGAFSGQQVGQRVNKLVDFDRNGQSELIASRLYQRGNAVDRESAAFVVGVNQTIGVLQPPDFSQATFAHAVAEGDFFGDATTAYAFGAPGVADGDGAIWLVGSDAALRGRVSGGDRGGFGTALAALPLQGATWLAIGGSAANEVVLADLAAQAGFSVAPPGGVPADTGFGVSLVTLGPLPDGTSRLFVGEPGHDGARGRVHVFSIR